MTWAKPTMFGRRRSTRRITSASISRGSMAFALTKNFGDKVAVAFAIENPQATLTTHGNAGNFLLGESWR